ncbi:MAG: molecular chaperone DnaJ [Actinomycetota bacterium]|nr:molecular chaperone DnaJ [Actinomycetota bacterium]
MRYITRPLTDEARARLKAGPRGQSSPFSSTWSATLEILDRELHQLGVRTEFVLQIDCSEADLRLDGQLRANARPASPAVAISIETRAKGALLFTCGRFHHWQDNVRAIALGLEALRKVERYGIVQSDEQYRGWQALPPGTPMPAAKMTYEEACRTITDLAHVTFISTGWVADQLDQLYRKGAMRCHPDHGGDPASFTRLVEARELIASRNAS